MNKLFKKSLLLITLFAVGKPCTVSAGMLGNISWPKITSRTIAVRLAVTAATLGAIWAAKEGYKIISNRNSCATANIQQPLRQDSVTNCECNDNDDAAKKFASLRDRFAGLKVFSPPLKELEETERKMPSIEKEIDSALEQLGKGRCTHCRNHLTSDKVIAQQKFLKTMQLPLKRAIKDHKRQKLAAIQREIDPIARNIDELNLNFLTHDEVNGYLSSLKRDLERLDALAVLEQQIEDGPDHTPLKQRIQRDMEKIPQLIQNAIKRLQEDSRQTIPHETDI